MRNILLATTGSVAAVVLSDKLRSRLELLGEVKLIHTGQQEQFSSWHPGDVIEHIALRDWASCLVVAPLSANTMAKMVNGLADNMVTNVYRAWDEVKPVIVAPAMNTMMWEKRITASHCITLENDGVEIVQPQIKTLACGETGNGAMADIDDIVFRTKQKLKWSGPLGKPWKLPVGPGEFNSLRGGYNHTGVDLYTTEGTTVHAVEPGRIVFHGQFTGPPVDKKWQPTWAVAVEGPAGVVVYGELYNNTNWRVGSLIKQGDILGHVKPVLRPDEARPDIPNHSTSMLHLELWERGTRGFKDWEPGIKDPTPYLKEILK